MYKIHSFLVLALLWGLSLPAHTKEQKLRLWYDRPAEKWTEALPVGNGRLGAMIFGGTAGNPCKITFNGKTIELNTTKNKSYYPK